MLPRGLKKVLKDTQPCKLAGSGVRKGFRTPGGTRLRGLTKRLEASVFSEGQLPAAALRSDAPAGGHWRGAGGGRRRGSAVDAQVSRLAGCPPGKRASSSMLVLTRLVFSALDARDLEPVLGQRGVCSERHRVGTAADIVCYHRQRQALVLVELKCGCAGWRNAPAVRDGAACTMKRSLSSAPDCVVNRHLAQLAVTHRLFCNERRTAAKLSVLGIAGVEGLLMYANDARVDAYELVPWWTAKAAGVLDDLA